MWRIVVVGWLMIFSLNVQASSVSMSLLDNRFRVDPTVKKVTFMIHRSDNSQPVVLVRPDGAKYYANKAKEDTNIDWYQESNMDIISVQNPMPGPWQAIGQVDPNNKVVLISDLALSVQTLPKKLYQSESLKFTAQLTSKGKPVVLKDFLEKVRLKVTFTSYVENEALLKGADKPTARVMGEFNDDGSKLDEFAADGVFTVALPIDITPGKYRMRITSENGVFLRTQEQDVLVYPTPYTVSFIQSYTENQDHQVIVNGSKGLLKPGSLALHLEHYLVQGSVNYLQATEQDKLMRIDLALPYHHEVGHYAWAGRLFATDLSTKRDLIFPIVKHGYSIVSSELLKMNREEQFKQKALEAQREIEQKMLQQREKQRNYSFIIIIVGNAFAVLLGILGWFVYKKLTLKRKLAAKMNLVIPE